MVGNNKSLVILRMDLDALVKKVEFMAKTFDQINDGDFSLNDVALVSKLSRLTLALAKKCWSKCGKQNPNAPVEQSATGGVPTTSPQMNQILPTDQSNSNRTILPVLNLIEQPSSQQFCLLVPSDEQSASPILSQEFDSQGKFDSQKTCSGFCYYAAVIAMSSENFLIDLLNRINDYVRYNTPDLESRIILERFLAVVALAFIQLLLVRVGFYVEGKPFKPFILDPFLLLTLPALALNHCYKLLTGHVDDYKYIKLDMDVDKEGKVVWTTYEQDPKLKTKGVAQESPLPEGRILVFLRRVEDRVAGLLVLADQQRTEFFLEKIPKCCIPHALPDLNGKIHQDQDGSCRHFPDGDATYRMVMAAIDLWKDNWAEVGESVDVFLHDKKFLAEMDLFLPWPRDIENASAGCDCKNLFGQAFGRPLVFHHSLDHACMTKEAEVWGELVAWIEVLAGSMLAWPSKHVDEAWNHTSLKGWPRIKRKLKLKNYHALTHPGSAVKQTTKKVSFDWAVKCKDISIVERNNMSLS